MYNFFLAIRLYPTYHKPIKPVCPYLEGPRNLYKSLSVSLFSKKSNCLSLFEGTEKVKSTFRLKVNGEEIVVFTLLFLSNIALLRRFVKSEVINRKHFPFLSFKMGTFSVPSKGERQFACLRKRLIDKLLRD